MTTINAINYLTEDEIVSVIRTNDVFANRSATGYGAKIPTQYKIKHINGRIYRMYCMIYSNSGSCYITVAGIDYFTGRVEYSDKFQNPIILPDARLAAQPQ